MRGTGLILLIIIAVLLFLWLRRRRRTGRRFPRPQFLGRQLAPLYLTVGQSQRMALVQRPSRRGGAVPLLLCFHGGVSEPSRFAEMSGLDAAAAASGFLAAFPSAPEGWADGRPERGDSVEDLDFTAALIARLAQDRMIDPKQVYAVGISSGGMFVQRLVTERPDLLTGAAAVLASTPASLAEEVADGPPVPFALICDRHDQIMPWSGGEIAHGPMRGAGGFVIPVEEALNLWLNRNNAYQQKPPVSISGPDGFSVEIYDYAARAGGAPVRFVAVAGAGHRWPRWPGSAGEAGFDAGETILDFFIQVRGPDDEGIERTEPATA